MRKHLHKKIKHLKVLFFLHNHPTKESKLFIFCLFFVAVVVVVVVFVAFVAFIQNQLAKWFVDT